jgi:hypothetical protein
MATQATGDREIGPAAERLSDKLVGRHDESRNGMMTSEFWVAVAAVIATLIAAAVSDILDARSAWWIVGVIASAYVVSRGIAKSGRGHRSGDRIDY